MPALDKIHETVIRALEKQGWRVERDPFVISIEGKLLFIDLMIQHIETRRIMLVEVKTFDDRSQITALASAIGKYMIYRYALAYQEETHVPLVLAIPQLAFDGIFNATWVQPLISETGIKFIVVNLETEEITAWT